MRILNEIRTVLKKRRKLTQRANTMRKIDEKPLQTIHKPEHNNIQSNGLCICRCLQFDDFSFGK